MTAVGGSGARQGSGSAAMVAALDDEIAEMWAALTEWARDESPPRWWRPDIALMANECVRRIAWLIEHDAGAMACWELLAQHVEASRA